MGAAHTAHAVMNWWMSWSIGPEAHLGKSRRIVARVARTALVCQLTATMHLDSPTTLVESVVVCMPLADSAQQKLDPSATDGRRHLRY